MNIHEHQAKALLRKFNVPVPDGKVAFTVEEAAEAAREFAAQGHNVVVVKSQIHAGGRGKGHVVDTNTREAVTLADGSAVRGVTVVVGGDLEARVKELAEKTLGNTLVTIQTGEGGKVVNRLLVEQGLNIENELYLSMLLDRSNSRNLIMASTEGGMEIEEVAEKTPEKIVKEHIDPAIGFQGFQARRLGFNLGLSGAALKSFIKLITNLVRAYEDLDGSMVEINPLVVTKEQEVYALDAKVNFDDNALYRHPDIAELRDLSEEEPLEIEASKYDLNYIKLDGNVGCMVNGAGLAMGTMDIIKLAGGEPANFLDVGGGANVERIANAFRIMLSDENVKAVLVNIFGGIVRCDRVANGILEAVKQVDCHVPVIVRLDGTNAVEAREILENSDLDFAVADTLATAAQKVNEAMSGAA